MLYFMLQVLIYLAACAALIMAPALLSFHVGQRIRCYRRIWIGIMAALPLPSIGTTLVVIIFRSVASYKPLPGDPTGGDGPGLFLLPVYVAAVWILSIVLGGAAAVVAMLLDERRRNSRSDQ